MCTYLWITYHCINIIKREIAYTICRIANSWNRLKYIYIIYILILKYVTSKNTTQ